MADINHIIFYFKDGKREEFKTGDKIKNIDLNAVGSFFGVIMDEYDKTESEILSQTTHVVMKLWPMDDIEHVWATEDRTIKTKTLQP